MTTRVELEAPEPAIDAGVTVDPRYQFALQAALGVVYEWVPSTGVVRRSDGLLDLLGFEASAVPPDIAWWRGRVHPDDRDALEATRRSDAAGSDTSTAEYRIRHRDGHWVDVLDRAVAMRDADGGPVRVIGHVIDVTQHRRHQRERVFLAGVDATLRAATTIDEATAVIDRLVATLDLARIVFAQVDPGDDRLVIRRRSGHGALRRGPIRLSGVIPRPIGLELASGATAVVDDADRATGTAGPLGGAWIAVPWSHDGRWNSVLIAAVDGARRWDPGEVRLVEAVAARLGPVLDRIEAEAALRMSESRFRLAASNGSITFFEQDADLRYRWLYPSPPEGTEAIGRRDVDLLPGPAGRRLARLKARVVRTGTPIRQEVAVPSADGVRWFDLTINPVVDPDGRVVGVSGVGLDVTRGKAAEVALRASEGQLRRALAVKDEFLGLVSHELRTPMTVILGMSRILRSDRLTIERAREVAGDIADSAEVLDGLVESMLLLARLDRDEADLMREPILLHRAAEEVLDTHRVRDPGRRYRFDDRSHGAIVDAQAMWIERIIENFLANASKYSRPRGVVTVQVDRVDGWGVVTVRDQGPKLSADALAHVFEPFYRAPAARDRAPGVGLGLAVAKRLVELLEGRIWARPLPHGGAEFGFALPLLPDLED